MVPAEKAEEQRVVDGRMNGSRRRKMVHAKTQRCKEWLKKNESVMITLTINNTAFSAGTVGCTFKQSII